MDIKVIKKLNLVELKKIERLPCSSLLVRIYQAPTS